MFHRRDREAQTITLADGRKLGFATYGDPSGYPLMSFHGGLSSRLDIDYADSAARDAGVWIISPDRPGLGMSTAQPNRRLLSWPTDVAALADQLGIGDFDTMGWSAGGPYAIACSAALGGRVTAGALLASAAPFDLVGGLRGLNRVDQIMITLSRYASPLAKLVLHTSITRASDQRLYGTLTEDFTPADLASVEHLSPEQATISVRESVKQGTGGSLHEYRILGGDWGFPLERARAPFDIWHGSLDDSGQPGEQDVLFERLPNARLHRIEGEGHFSIGRNHMPEILATLLARRSDPRGDRE